MKLAATPKSTPMSFVVSGIHPGPSTKGMEQPWGQTPWRARPMLAAVLHTPTAIEVSIRIMDVFVAMRQARCHPWRGIAQEYSSSPKAEPCGGRGCAGRRLRAMLSFLSACFWRGGRGGDEGLRERRNAQSPVLQGIRGVVPTGFQSRL